jgi:hypothetical protein
MKRYWCSGLVSVRIAWRLSSCARTVTVGIAIAAKSAANGRGESNGGGPISVISAARKGGSIIVTDNATTGNGANSARP